MTITFVVIAVIVLVVLAVAFFIRKKNQDANVARAEQLRSQAATQAQTTLPPAQDRAAEAEAKAEEARVAAERAQAEAEAARLSAARAEAEHEARVRAADRLDPRVDDTSDDYAPQVAGTVDQQPTPPSEVDVTPESAPAEQAEQAETPTQGTPLLPRRTPGANEMPGKPLEAEGGSGGWFTRKDESDKA